MARRFLAILMAMCMCLGIPTAAFATEVVPNVAGEVDRVTVDTINASTDPIGGTETWNGGMRVSDWFTIEGNNLTPVKTIGMDGKLSLLVYYNSDTPVKLRIQIRKAGTKENIVQWTTGANTYYENDFPLIDVKEGQKIQISFRVLDANGNYDDSRELTMSYGYILSAT